MSAFGDYLLSLHDEEDTLWHCPYTAHGFETSYVVPRKNFNTGDIKEYLFSLDENLMTRQ